MDAIENEALQSHSAHLLITSRRCRKRFLAMILSRPVWLTRSEVSLLLELIVGRLNPKTDGFVKDALNAYPTAIYRVRKKLDQAVGSGTGERLVETGTSAEYRLESCVRPRVERNIEEALDVPRYVSEALERANIYVD